MEAALPSRNPRDPDAPPLADRSADIDLAAVTLQAMATAASAGLPVTKAAVRDTVALIRAHL